MHRLALKSALLAATVLVSASAIAQADQVPGSAPASLSPRVQNLLPEDVRPLAASGLRVFFRRFDKLTISVDAAGGNNPSNVISVTKPSKGAVVQKAFLMAASNSAVNFTSGTPIVIANGDVRLNGKSVSWIDSETNDIPNFPGFFNSVLADVTSIVKPKVDAFNKAGTINFPIGESNAKNTSIDGEVLVVVFKDPSLPAKRTIALLFGGQQLAGDRFEVTLDKPIDPAKANAKAEMGLGVSYSYQSGGSQQYSVIDVNGKRLSTSAGGEDDGQPANGALITAGGIGDSPKNPASRTATPNNPRSDDERYNLLPFITKTARTIRIDTLNPSNDDNIFFAWFDLSAEGDVNKDTDGDGLLDSWETKGYDHNGDGVIDVPIHKRGANPRKKDIFIAYAYMAKGPAETASHQPSFAVLNAVTQAFARAPVSNPNGTTGISMHFLNKGSVAHDDDLNEVWSEFDALMNPKVSEAERRIYHRMLNAHAYGGGGSSGLSRDIPASDFIESLGKFSTNPGTFKQRAGTIMHELGHNLGLRHGGVDHENYKPNHLSVMSYLNQFDWLTKGGNAVLDYERFRLADLKETSLSESVGLNRIGGDGPIASYGVRWISGGLLRSKATGASANVDWNVNGVATNTGISVDLNGSGALSTLRANFSEWANIVYDGGEVGAGRPEEKASLLTKKKDLDELTEEAYRRFLGR